MSFPGIDPAHVAEEILRLVPPDQRQEVFRLLESVRGGPGDLTWIRLAVLNLVSGRVELLPQWIELANTDTRDLILFVQSQLDPTWDARFQWPVDVAARQPPK